MIRHTFFKGVFQANLKKINNINDLMEQPSGIYWLEVSYLFSVYNGLLEPVKIPSRFKVLFDVI